MQPGLEYQYRYSGRLATGITDMRLQYAAVGIQADVTVQVEEDYSFLIQLQNMETGEFHDDLACDHVSPLPITYAQIQEGAEFIHTPFRITMNGTENIGALEVPIDEPSWITNLRKSIIDIFPLAALWKEIQRSGGQRFLRPNFGAEDDLIGGHCMNWYTVTKVPDDEAAREEQLIESQIEEDVQHEGSASASYTSSKGHAKGSAKGHSKGRGRKGSKSSKGSHPPPSRYTTPVPPIVDSLWNVVRVVDYDLCEDNVITATINAPENTAQLVSRTSVAHYLLRGSQLGIRVEKAVVEGAISVFSSRNQEDRIDTFTNQTIELRAVRRISTKLTINYEVRRTDHWYFEDDRSTEVEGEGMHLSLEERLTGIHLTEAVISQIKADVRSGLRGLVSGPTDNLAEAMKRLADAISYLPLQQISELFEEFVAERSGFTDMSSSDERRKADLTIENLKIALIASGSEAALTFLVDIMQNDFRTFREKTLVMFFKNVQTSVKNPAMVTKIVNLAMALPWDDDGLASKSIALTSAASLARKLCFSPERRRTYTDNTCNNGNVCHTNAILNTFLPYLQDVLKDGSSPMSHKLVCLQALNNLGTPQTLDAIIPIILGTTDSNVGLRTIAILSISSNVMHHSALGMVYKLLTPIIANKGDHPQVRSMAFLVMTSWNPGPAWWKHMAISTWHEPSSQVANLISSAIHAIANSQHEIAQTASRVLHLAKPVAPSSLTHSSMVYLQDYVFSKDFNREMGLMWFASTEGLLPTHLSINVMLQVLYGFPSASKLTLNQSHLYKMILIWLELRAQSPRSENHEIVREIMQEKLEQLGIELPDFESEVNFWLTHDDILYFAYQFGLPTFNGAPNYALNDLLKLIPTYYPAISHYETVDSTITFPTDLGIPVIIKHSVQSAAQLQLTKVDTPSDFASLLQHYTFGVDIQVSYLASIDMKTLVPWSNKFAVGAGLKNEMDIKLPFALNAALKKETYQLALRVEPLSQNQVHFLHALNHPYTVQYGSFPTSLTSSHNDFRIIKRYDDDQYKREGQLIPSSGLSLEFSWIASDMEVPTISSIIRGEFLFLAPMHNTWECKVIRDPAASDTKSITAIFTYASIKLEGQQEEELGEFTQFGQESQGSVDYSDYSQFSQSASQDYSQFSQSQGAGLQEFNVDYISGDQLGFHEAHLSVTHLLERLSITSGSYKIVSVALALDGSIPVSYTAGFVLGKDKISTSESQSTLGIELDLRVGEIAEPQKTCVKITSAKPLILPFSTMEGILAIDLTSNIKGQIHIGNDCKNTPVFDLQGTLEVSESQKSQVREKVNKGCETSNTEPALDIVTSQVYDQVHLKATWTDSFPLAWINRTYHAYDILRKVYYRELSYDYTTTNADYAIDIDATKNLITNLWTVRFTKPHEVSVLHGMIPVLIGTPAGSQISILHNFINGRNPSSCVIEDTEVSTFDGKVFPFTPDSCWKIAALDCMSGRAMFQVRNTGEWEAQVLWDEEGLFFDITSSQIMVNGESANYDDDRYQIVQQSESILVVFSTRAAIKVSNKVEIYSPPELRSLPCGLCGNFDGEETSDLVGPSGCVYSDPALFAYSWTVSGDGCNAFSLRSHKQKVKNYASDCPKKSYLPTGVSHNNIHHDCISWEYQERNEGVNKYIAITPTPKCNSGCAPTYFMQEEIVYDYVVTEGDLQEVNQCYTHTFITNFPADCTPVSG